MQNRLVHHLIGTKLCCALPKCISVQNYIVNLDLHVRCQPQKYYRFIYIRACALPVYVHCHPTWEKCPTLFWCPTKYGQKVFVFSMFLVTHQKVKNVMGDPHI